MRMSRNEYFMKIAKTVAERSTCDRAKVGCILVDAETNNIVGTGYNGSVKKSVHCNDVGCLMFNNHCRRTIHSELNAILHLDRRYLKLIAYCTHQPCVECYKALVTVNVQEIFYRNDYEDEVRDEIEKEIDGLASRMYKI